MPYKCNAAIQIPVIFSCKMYHVCHTCSSTVTLHVYFNNFATGSKSGQLWRGLSSKAVCCICTHHTANDFLTQYSSTCIAWLCSSGSWKWEHERNDEVAYTSFTFTHWSGIYAPLWHPLQNDYEWQISGPHFQQYVVSVCFLFTHAPTGTRNKLLSFSLARI